MRFRNAALVLTFIFLIPAFVHAAPLENGRISLVEGDVQIYTQDAADWLPASINMPLQEWDRIWVPAGGRVELQLRDGSLVRLNGGSSLDIVALEGNSFRFYLNAGRAYVNFKGREESLLQMGTPLTSLKADERAKFRVDVADDGGTELSVSLGAVYSESALGKTRVASGQRLSLEEESTEGPSLARPQDEWDRWNRKRDRELAARGYSSQYLPDELRGYGYDMDANGRWVYAVDYGYVWTPRVGISIGWSPYRTGRWCWIGGDYVWISYEPWGWVPYHYGRWAFVVSIGWCWVPPARGAVYWGPGYVGWVYTPSYVAWVPLAPGEIYYGHGHFGPHSVNITNVNIDRTVIKTVYKNVHVKNAVTVVNRKTFVTGRHEPVKIRENPFLKERVSVGRPKIQPEKATRLPVVKEIPAGKQPPHPVREVRGRELREKERPLPSPKPERPERITPPKRLREPREGVEIFRGKAVPPGEVAPAPRPVKPEKVRPPKLPKEQREGGVEIYRGRAVPPEQPKRLERERRPEREGRPEPRQFKVPEGIRPAAPGASPEAYPPSEKRKEMRLPESKPPPAQKPEGTRALPEKRVAPAPTVKEAPQRPGVAPPPRVPKDTKPKKEKMPPEEGSREMKEKQKKTEEH